MGALLVHGHQVQLKLEGGRRVRQQKRLPDWELEGSNMMPCDLDGRRDFPWGPKEGFPWSKGRHVTESVCHEGLFLLSVSVPRFISHEGQ